MLDDRKAAILRAVVECHIRTAQPVSSAYVAQRDDLSISPATVRNEMAVLEQEGYLFQPHFSAGRVPTDKGYRFFVDSLSGPSPLGPAQAELVRMFFTRTHGEIERMLAETSGLLSRLTDYAAVVVTPSGPEPGRVRSAQLVRLHPRLVLAVAVLGNGSIERRPLEVPLPVSDAQVERASAAIASFLVGSALDPGGYPPPTGDPAADSLGAAALEALRSPEGELARSHVFVGGAARMAAAFDAVSTIRAVLGILEQQYVLVTLLKDVIDRGLTVAIGAEHGVVPLVDCSVVVAPYEVDGERAGTVGVLGPTRMHYDQALAAVAVVSKKLTKALSEGDRRHRGAGQPAANGLSAHGEHRSAG
ncbi:MAG: heat-inducible transcriptional repressor HrcA [Acidimicrobiales bacterium]